MAGTHKHSQAQKHRARVLCAQALSLGINVSTSEILDNIAQWETIIHHHTIAKTRQENTDNA